MNIKKIIALIMCVVLVVMCSGCSLDFFSVESLLSPPVQSGKNGEVQKAFNTLMKDKMVQLKTPASGDYQTAFVLYDINADGIDEALVFYSDTSVESTVRMALLECVDDEWMISADIKGAGSGVFDICFNDLDGDGFSEIFVSWSLFDNKITRVVSVYEPIFTNDGAFTLESIGSEYSNTKSFLDFNGDLKNDLVIVYIDDTAEIQKSVLRFFSLSPEKQLVKYSEINIDSSITSVESISSDVIKAGDKSYSRLFIDCLKNEKMMFTDMVYWDVENSKPVRGLTEPNITTVRNSKILSRDIDNDGNIEIPVITTLKGDSKQFSLTDYDNVYTFTLLKWIDVKGDNHQDNVQTLYNPLEEYLLRFSWNGRISIRYDSVQTALLFCEWNEANKSYGDELFSIAYREVKDDAPYGEILYECDEGVYYYEITDDGADYGITEDILISSFIKV